MSSLNEALGLEPDAAVESFRPYLVTGTVVSSNADAAMLSFVHGGHEVTGALPVTEQPDAHQWVPGAVHAVVLCEPIMPGGLPRLSLVRSELVSETLASLSPEVRAGDVRIMGVARRPGLRTKIAVASTVAGLDPIAACVGRSHNRVDALRSALGGEQVDIIAWHPDQEQFLRNALQPASISNITIDATARTAIAATPHHQMSAAVGAAGLNSALAGKLVGLMVKIVAA